MIDSTVIIPNHNRLGLLHAAIASVLKQEAVSLDVERMRMGRPIIVDRYAPLAVQQAVSSTEVRYERYRRSGTPQ